MPRNVMLARVPFDDSDPWKPNFLDTLDVARVTRNLAQCYRAIPSYRRAAEAIDCVAEAGVSLVEIRVAVRLLDQFMAIHPVHSEPVLSMVGWRPAPPKLVALMLDPSGVPHGDFGPQPPPYLVCELTLKLLQFVVGHHKVHVEVLEDNHYHLMSQWNPELVDRISAYAERLFRLHLAALESPPAHACALPQLVYLVDSTDDTAVEFEPKLEAPVRLKLSESQATTLLSPTLSTFISDTDNLRHNELLVLDDLNEVECNYIDEPKKVPTHQLFSIPLQSALRPTTRHNIPVAPMSPLKRYGQLSQPVTRQSLFKLPRRLRQLLSLLDPRNPNLEEEALSETVPRYIKDNKRLKYIKVGKVQKFVNLFEERAEVPTSPCSPQKWHSRSSSITSETFSLG